MKYFSFLSLAIFVGGCSALSPKEKLRIRFAEIVASTDATVGIGILDLSTGDTLTLNGNNHFPMQSVYKVHVALAALRLVDEGKLDLNQKIFIAKKDLLPDTHSPLRDDFPNGDTTLLLSEVLTYTVSKGDNNGCDILFRVVGGTEFVNDFVHNGLKVGDVMITATEEEMHKAWEIQFTNWSTPASVLDLLAKSQNSNYFSLRSADFFWKIMVETATGPNRLKKLLPPEAIVAHKTGYSGVNEKGITAAVNDVGIVQMADGRRYAIAVFVSDTKESLQLSEKIIADISRAAWDHFINNKESE
jgi:beta-lactamase class A